MNHISHIPRSRLLGAIAALVLGVSATAQVTYTQNFSVNAASWTGDFAHFTGATTCGGAGGAMRANIYNFNTSDNLVSPNLGTSLGNSTTVTYDYKCANWNATPALENVTPTATPWGSFNVQYAASASGPWTTIATVSNETQIAGCQPKSHTFTPPAGALFLRFNALWTAGDFYVNFDNITVSESVSGCSGTPTPGNTTGPADVCPGANFTLGLQNATSGSGVSYQWYASTAGAGGPFSPVGTSAPTLTTSQLVQSWYFCDVTCSAGPSTGSSNVLQVNISSPAFAQEFNTGVVNPNCWSVAALVGSDLPNYATQSAFSVGTGSVRFNFFNISNNNELALISPGFAPTVGGTQVYFDIAGATYDGGEIDEMVLEESSDNGATWSAVVTMTNEPGIGVMNTLGGTGTTTSNFVPTAGQWSSLAYTVTAGTNRIRFRGISNFGNSVFLDNISVGVLPSARHTVYGASCATPAFTLTASPAPISGTTTNFALGDVPLACPNPAPVFHFGIVIISFNQDFPGTDLLAGYGVDSPGCKLHVSSFDVLFSFVDTVPNQVLPLTLPLSTPAGLTFYSQAVALICAAPPNNAGFVTSTALRSYVNSF